MKDDLTAAVWRLGVFVVACVVAVVCCVLIFAQLRFGEDTSYRAEFANVTGLEAGNFVRIGGVEVGKVEHISIRRDAVAVVQFSTDDTVRLTQGSEAAIRYDNLIGGRYLELLQGAGDPARLAPGQTIPLQRTRPALDLDALIGGFRPLFRALDPEQVNALSAQLISAFQGQGATIGAFLSQTASFTSALAERDELIGQVIVNLKTVLGTLSEQSAEVDDTVVTLSELVSGLAEGRTQLASGLAEVSAGAAVLAESTEQIRRPLPEALHQTDRVAGIVVADHDYVDDLLETLPEAYQILGRQGIYGDFFSFYLCEAVLKVNGKGGQPVYVKIAGQSSGRCAPR